MRHREAYVTPLIAIWMMAVNPVPSLGQEGCSTANTAAAPSPAYPGAATDPGRAVLTQHNGNQRTGAYLSERQLNVATVCSSRFGKLYSLKVEGQIYAQPLYVPNLVMNDGRSHNVLFVATMRNKVYAFDADSNPGGLSRPLWSMSLGTPVPYNFMPMPGSVLGKYNIKPDIGITGTPVIDTAGKTIYLVSKSCTRPQSSDCAHRQGLDVTNTLHALDLTSGGERPGSPREIKAHCVDSTGGRERFVVLRASRHLQRAGLLLAGGRLYMAFGSHADEPSFHGWILSYDAHSLQPQAAFCTTPHASGGAIWQAGNGLVADSAGQIYALTGNSLKHEQPGPRDMNNSLIKLDRDLKLLDWFIPANEACLSKHDVDLGAAGVTLMPGTSLLVGGGKEGVMYLVDATNLGKRQAPTSRSVEDKAPCRRSGSSDAPPPLQSFQAARNWESSVMAAVLKVFGYHHIHGSPVYYRNPSSGPVIFVWPERDYLRAFKFDSSTRRFPDTAPPGSKPKDSYHSRRPNAEHGMPGGILSLSADGREGAPGWPSGHPSTGIVWALMPLKDDAFTKVVPGILRAFRASDLAELWNSEKPAGNRTGLFAKYTPPTIADGKVFVATFSNRIDVYGLKPAP
jgi:hypothetical protein